MYPLNLLAGIAATPSSGAVESDHPALALLIVASVMTCAVVVETVRHHRRRQVHHPVPIPARRAVRGAVPPERKHREYSKQPVLLAHRS